MSRTIRPWFTFFGFRYIKITSSLPIDPALFVGRAVYSEMERTGFISTSHEKLNRLYENCLYRTLADQIKASILQEFYSPSGRLTVDTQTGYLLALNFQVHHSREKILEGLKQRLERDNYRIRTGFVGTALMPTVFGDNDMVDEFYDFLFYEGFPGWLYAINLGATTIWERWNSLSPDGSISGTSMHSLNHYAFGSVVEFLYRYTAGIIPVKPGFREIRLEPKPNWRLHSFNCRYDSPAGTYVSKWHFHSDGRLTVDLEIPFGAEAIVTLPDSETAPFRLSSGCFSYTYMPKRDYRTPFNEHTRLEILAEHKAAVEVLKEYLPRKHEAICTGNVDELSCTLADELRKTQKVGYPPERLDSIERAVVDMFCFPEADLQNAISAIKQIKVEV